MIKAGLFLMRIIMRSTLKLVYQAFVLVYLMLASFFFFFNSPQSSFLVYIPLKLLPLHSSVTSTLPNTVKIFFHIIQPSPALGVSDHYHFPFLAFFTPLIPARPLIWPCLYGCFSPLSFIVFSSHLNVNFPSLYLLPR